jgi:putative phosphoribosyl transferase
MNCEDSITAHEPPAMETKLYEDRHDAGRRLAPLLSGFAGAADTLVLGLPRGGVVVAYEIAEALDLPLDVLVVRKLGFPSHPEFAMGAIASGDVVVTNEEVLAQVAGSGEMLRRVMEEEKMELHRREEIFRHGRPMEDVRGKTVLLIDDGIATGATMRAAIQSLQQRRVKRCIAAVPVASPQACEEISGLADKVVCPLMPPNFRGVGQFYLNFEQTTDEEVIALVEQRMLTV